MNTEAIVYLLRKTSLTRDEIGKLSPPQFNEIIKEVSFQESVEEYQKQYLTALLLAAIGNTIPRQKGSKVLQATDFLKGDKPSRFVKKNKSIDDIAREKNIQMPTNELKKREE